MNPEVAELVVRLRGSRRAELLRIVKDAGLDAPPPAPEPEVVEPYRWLIGRIGSGIKLTPSGYLPTAVVEEGMRSLGWIDDWPGTRYREDLTAPIGDLRESARQLGLVRVYRNELRRTTAGARLMDDPVGLWRHIAARLPLGRSEPERHAGWLWLLAVSAGRARQDSLAQGMDVLGWVEGETGRPLEEYEAEIAARPTWVVFARLGLLAERGYQERPTAPAIALARAALLHEEAPTPIKPVPAVELTVTLREVRPAVRRRIVVPARTTFQQLHGLLQAAMGWQDAHLWQFEWDGVRYGDLEDADDDLADPRKVTVDAVPDGTTLTYEYDFGDGWDHEIRVVRHTAAAAPACLEGAHACPPEDCGGPYGYRRLLDVLADPSHPERADLVEWLGGPFDPEAFDATAATTAMRRAVRRR